MHLVEAVRRPDAGVVSTLMLMELYPPSWKPGSQADSYGRGVRVDKQVCRHSRIWRVIWLLGALVFPFL